MKVKKVPEGVLSDGITRYWFYCPGCKHRHSIPINGPKAWQFNGDVNNPTFAPSLLNTWGKEADPNWKEPEGAGANNGWSGRCHLFLKNGVIEFLTDCTHDFAGKSYPLPEMDTSDI